MVPNWWESEDENSLSNDLPSKHRKNITNLTRVNLYGHGFSAPFYW